MNSFRLNLLVVKSAGAPAFRTAAAIGASKPFCKLTPVKQPVAFVLRMLLLLAVLTALCGCSATTSFMDEGKQSATAGDWDSAVRSYQQAYQENQIALSSALARKEGMMDEIRRLERAKAAAAFEADLKEHETQAIAAGEQESRLTALTEAIEKHKKDLAELSERAQTTQKDLDEALQRQAAGAETLEAAIAADREVNAAAAVDLA